MSVGTPSLLRTILGLGYCPLWTGTSSTPSPTPTLGLRDDRCPSTRHPWTEETEGQDDEEGKGKPFSSPPGRVGTE